MTQPPNVAQFFGPIGQFKRITVLDGGSLITPNLDVETIRGGVSATAVVIVSGNTIATKELRVSRVAPAAAVNSVLLEPGLYDGQEVTVVNVSSVGSTISFGADGTSKVARGTNITIPGSSAMKFVWVNASTRWFMVLTEYGAQSSTAVATLDNGTIATSGLKVSRVNPAAARTGVILESGGYLDQEVLVVNQAAAVNTITMAVSGTSHVANGVSCVISGLTAMRFVWIGATSLWYPV